MSVEFGLFIAAAYLLTSIPASYLAARLYKGIDLREFGSGTVGSSNLYRATSSKTLTAIVAMWDLGKGALIVWMAKMAGLSTAQYVAVGVSAICGHNWPVFLYFNGGRGVLTGAGVTFFLFFPWGIIIFVGIGLFTLIRMASPLPVLLASAAQPPASLLLNEPVEITLGLLAIFFMVVVRRLTAPRTSDVPLDREFFINRLLYDRDKKDGEEWVRRKIDRKSLRKQ